MVELTDDYKVLVADTRHSADAASLLTDATLQVAHWLAWVAVDVRVRLAAARAGTLVTAQAWLAHIHSLDIVAIKVDISGLARALREGIDTLVETSVPWLAVLAIRTARRTGIGAALAECRRAAGSGGDGSERTDRHDTGGNVAVEHLVKEGYLSEREQVGE